MKKLQYIQPQTIVVRMQTVHMIAGSNENKITGDVNNTKLNPGSMVGDDGGDAASRRHRNDWDDEEDDW